MHITIKSGFKLQLSSEWNVESVQILKFPEDMIEVNKLHHSCTKLILKHKRQ
jgi:hypothetical protein